MAMKPSSFESFPVAFRDEEEAITTTLQSKIKRLFSTPTPSISTTSTSNYSTTNSSTTSVASRADSSTIDLDSPAGGIGGTLPLSTSSSTTHSRKPSSSTRDRDRDATSSSSHSINSLSQPLTNATTSTSALPTAAPNPLLPKPVNKHSSSPHQPDFPILPNGRRMVRPIRLSISGVARPSVRLTVTHAEKGDLVQSGSSRSIASDYRSDLGSSIGSGGGAGVGSPTASESFSAGLANFSSIPGFPLGRDQGDDARSIRSVSTVGGGGGNSASVAQVFRRLRGEGLSKDYWIRDESSRECFDCQTVFTAFRRKHHCRICGQIFCSRCASNIISSARFGSRGFVRVCNLCLSIMEDPTSSAADEGPASRFRSGLRESTTLTISAPLEASARPPQSQFAASHLFPRSETPYYLPPESNYGGRAMSDVSSRPGTPMDFFDNNDEGGDRERERGRKRRSFGSPLGDFAHNRDQEMMIKRGGTSPPMGVAPFRRELAEDDKAIEEGIDGLGITENETEEGADLEVEGEVDPDLVEEEMADGVDDVLQSGKDLEIDAVAGATILEEHPSPLVNNSRPASVVVDRTSPAMASIQSFKPQEALVTPKASSLQQASPRLFELSTSPDAVLSHFTTISNSPNVHHNFASNYALPSPGRTGLLSPTMDHLRKMLRQTLQRAKIPNISTWEKELMRLFVKVINGTAPNIRQGDSIDIRKHIHVKKIPGGTPKDSEYVAGFVFTKNVVHKQMARHLSNPRIMLLSFSLEYQRVENQLMSLEPLLKQEREYLHNLVARIAAQRPHVILVERNVSRIALEYLMDAGIAVARNVKPEVIAAVSRATSAFVVKSMDQIAQARLGRCATFRIQTYVHSLIPGQRKSLIRFEGCNEELGCTLLLRGGSMEVLEKIKKIVDVMVLIVYSAKLEGHLVRDELVVPLTAKPIFFDPFYSLRSVVTTPNFDERLLRNLNLDDSERLSKAIAESLEPYTSTVLSSSPWVKFQPPYQLTKMKEEDKRVIALRKAQQEEEMAEIVEAESAAASSRGRSSISASSSSLSLFSLTTSERSATRSYSEYQQQPHSVLQTEEDVARKHAFSQAEARHAKALELWEAYLRDSHDSLDPASHQKLHVLESLGCSQTDRLCQPPSLREIEFYGKGDLTIGQFIESFVEAAGATCRTPTCTRPMMAHYRTWVHGNHRVSIIPEVHYLDLHVEELYDKIVMWGFCKLCSVRSAQTVMSDETFRLSFGKYLESCFYADNLVRFDQMCSHNAHLDHVRYWSYKGICFQIQPEVIDLRDIMPPPLQLTTRPEKHLHLRNEEYNTVLRKSTAFWDSIAHRITAFNYDLVAADRLEESHVAMEDLRARCEVDRVAITKLLEKTYIEVQETNGTEMTSVRRALQNKAVEWEGDFAAFEQRIFPTERDVRRLTTVQLKRLFLDAALPLSPERKASPSILSPSVELDEKQETCGADLAASISSDVTSQHLRQLSSEFASSSSCSTTSADLTDASSLPSPSLSMSSFPSPSLSSDLIANIPIILHSTDNESDSTVCADGASSRRVRTSSPFLLGMGDHFPEETSGAESDCDVRAMTRLPPSGVAGLVKYFSDGEDDGKRPLPVVRPGLRRGVTERPRASKTHRATPDVFSDGDGGSYARNVGVSHLSNRLQVLDKPSKIPARKTIGRTNSLAQIFDDPDHLVRVGSRSGRSTPALTRQDSAESSAITVRPRPHLWSAHSSAHSSARSTKGKSTDPSGSPEEIPVRSSTKRSSKDVGISRPTTSSINKAAAPRRAASGQHSVAAITKHFNKMTREAEKERQRKMALVRNKRARPVAVTQPTVQVFDNVRDAVKEDSDSDETHSSDGADDEFDDDGDVEVGEREDDRRNSTSGPDADQTLCAAEATKSTDETSAGEMPADALLHHPAARAPELVAPDEISHRVEAATDSEAPSVPPSPRLDGYSIPRMSEGESSGNERGSIIKAISNLWSYRGGEFTPLDYPLRASEHIFADNPILVREDEPSSILAFTLSSKAYSDKLKEHDTARVVERSEAFMPDEFHHPNDKSTTWGLLDLQDGEDVEETLRKPEAKHFRLQFEEGTTKFSCKVFFAEQFDALRRNCGCSSQFIESLARCVKWESSGGKSKADFLKTQDDRFIVKEISRLEMDALLRFAPAYFDYMSKAFFHGLPTILAKIYGFYRIGLRNPTNGKVIRLDVLVTENLFYDRKLTQVYDLKGSTRNRHVMVSKDRPEEVLMDENLVEISHKTPLYVRESSKRFITAAVFNDSLFLSNANVMDYSLVCGVDSVQSELCVGIVDFIRTYTWDKRLESWVKDTALLGGGSSKPGGPTIVTPKQYKTRFREAMSGYFLLAPDPWLSLRPSAPPCSAESKEAYVSDAPGLNLGARAGS